MSSHNLGKILTSLMQECMIDDGFLSRQTKIPLTTLSRIKNEPSSNPRISTLTPIAEFFNISIDQLIGKTPMPKERLKGSFSKPDFTSTRIPIISPSELNEWKQGNYDKRKLFKSTKWLSTEKKLPEDSFALHIETTSYEPIFRKNSILIVENITEVYEEDYIIISYKKNANYSIVEVVADGDVFYSRSICSGKVNRIYADSYVYGRIVEARYIKQSSQRLSDKEMQKEKKHVINKSQVLTQPI